MTHVIVFDSVDQDIFVCGICKSVFNSLQLFLNHKSLECKTSVTNYISDNISTSTEVQLSHHSTESINYSAQTEKVQLDDTNPSYSFSCHICQKQFKHRNGLTTHARSHNGKHFQCLVCGRCFVQKTHLQRHFLSHKVWPFSLSETTAKTSEAELLSYFCPYCQTSFSNYNGFRSHLKNHQTIKKYKCIQGDCSHFAESIENLLEHVSLQHETLSYTCHVCTDSFGSLSDIAAHQQVHNDISESVQSEKFKCRKCDASFTKADKLSLHMLTENHKKNCIHCKKTFSSDKRLRLHLQIHRQTKPYQCNICDSSFHMKKYLSTHMLKHGNREFKCSICKKTFKRSDLLQRHMQLHQNSKLKCPYADISGCNKEFTRKDKLKIHLTCHSKQGQENIKQEGNNNELPVAE